MAALVDKLISNIYNFSITDGGEESIVEKNSSVCPIVLLWLTSNTFTPQVITISERKPSEEEERSLLDNQSSLMVIDDGVIILCMMCSPASWI